VYEKKHRLLEKEKLNRWRIFTELSVKKNSRGESSILSRPLRGKMAANYSRERKKKKKKEQHRVLIVPILQKGEKRFFAQSRLL